MLTSVNNGSEAVRTMGRFPNPALEFTPLFWYKVPAITVLDRELASTEMPVSSPATMLLSNVGPALFSTRIPMSFVPPP